MAAPVYGPTKPDQFGHHLRGTQLAWMAKESSQGLTMMTAVPPLPGACDTSRQDEEIKRLKAENRRLRDDVAILKAATSFLASMPS